MSILDHQKVDLKNLSPEELVVFLAGLEKEKFRSRQIMQWIYQRGVSKFAEMTDLAKSFRGLLDEHAFVSEWVPETVEISRDGTRKFLFRLTDQKTIETVLIPMDKGRNTLCISTQVGCAMQCSFCLTGSFGLDRNLDVSEIVNQVCAVRALHNVENIVLMGMGEPLGNLSNVIKALKVFYAKSGLNYSPRKVTLSTAGLVPELQVLGQSIKVNLAVSLNATTNELRDRLMPINRRYPLEMLMAACRDYPLSPRQRITFEYILIRGINDSLADARRLVTLLHGVKAKVNLIIFNEHSGSDFRAPEPAAIDAFQDYLLRRSMVAVRRASKGQDISAACGQLKGKQDTNQRATSV